MDANISIHDLEAMSRKELQALAKQFGLKANMKSKMLRSNLREVLSSSSAVHVEEEEEEECDALSSSSIASSPLKNNEPVVEELPSVGKTASNRENLLVEEKHQESENESDKENEDLHAGTDTFLHEKEEFQHENQSPSKVVEEEVVNDDSDLQPLREEKIQCTVDVAETVVELSKNNENLESSVSDFSKDDEEEKRKMEVEKEFQVNVDDEDQHLSTSKEKESDEFDERQENIIPAGKDSPNCSGESENRSWEPNDISSKDSAKVFEDRSEGKIKEPKSSEKSEDKNSEFLASQGTSTMHCPETFDSETGMPTDIRSCCAEEEKMNNNDQIRLRIGSNKSEIYAGENTVQNTSPWEAQEQKNDDMGLMTHLAFMQTKPASGIVHGNVDQARTKLALVPPPTLCGLPGTIMEEGSEVDTDNEDESTLEDTHESSAPEKDGTQKLTELATDNNMSAQVEVASSNGHRQSSRVSAIPVGLKRVAPMADDSSTQRKRLRLEKGPAAAPASTSLTSGRKYPAYRKRPAHVGNVRTKKTLQRKHKTSRDPLGAVSNNRQLLGPSSTKENIALKERRYRSNSNSKAAFGRVKPELGNRSRVSLGNISNSDNTNPKPFKANLSKQRDMPLPERESKTMQKFLERQERGRADHAKKSIPAAFHR